jgi:oligoribonuclease NrnB/cAMP/cGMP phosphodiesterase (DHH superfamily)
MLKIKDNVDLKELEKFGLEKDNEYIKIDGDLIIYSKYCWKDMYLYITENRIIYAEQCDYIKGQVLGGNENFDTLYDLIKADLVEKVSDKE